MDLLFMWTPALVYVILLVSMFVPVSLRRIGRGFAMSIVGYIAASACEFAVIFIFIANPYPSGRAVDVRTLTLPGVIVSFGIWAISMRLPYLVGTACALWGAAPKAESSIRLAE
jgi:hypothetical protein